MTQLAIDFEKVRFNGPDLTAADNARLGAQFIRVLNFAATGWHTLKEIAEATGDPEASVSAQLRHAKKERFGGHALEREYLGGGLYRYRIVLNAPSP